VGKFILTMQMSLDGVVSDVEQWMTLSDEMLDDMLKYYDKLEAVLVGGNTYLHLANYWQNAEKTSNSDLERSIAKKINEIKKFVISRSEVDLVWRNSEQIIYQDTDSLVHEMEQLRKSVSGNISVESGVRTWQLFIRNALFDDLWLFVHPVVVGGGDKLFPDAGDKRPLRLINNSIYQNGVIDLYYQMI
jgi:dihydrofolate reductase